LPRHVQVMTMTVDWMEYHLILMTESWQKKRR